MSRAYLLAVTLVIAGAHAAPAGTLKGVVKAQMASVPAPAVIKMDEDATCVQKHTSPVTVDHLVLDANKNLKNVFVYIKSGLEGQTFRAPQEPVVLDQNGCMFAPHVLGMMVGQGLKVLNSDGILHNVHVVPKANREINKAMPAFSKKIVLPGANFAKPEVMIPIKCDAHPWMSAYVAVVSNPFFAVTAADGSFEIKDVPPGAYVVEAWHEMLGAKTQNVQVGDGAATANFTLSK